MNIRSLKSKILIPIVILTIIGLSTLTTVSYIKSKGALSESINAQIYQIADSNVKLLDRWLMERKVDVSKWSTDDHFTSVFYNENAKKEATDKLENLVKYHDYFEVIAVSDKNGVPIVASNPSFLVSVNIKDREYFRIAMDGNEPPPQVVKSRGSGHPVVIIAMPMYGGGDTKPSGIILALINLTDFSNTFIDPISIGKNGFAYMVDTNGLTIAHKKQKFNFN